MSVRSLLPRFLRSRWLRTFTVLILLISMVTGVPPVLSGRLPSAVAVDPACTTSTLPPPSSTTADPGVTTVIQQDGGTVEVPPAAVTSPTTIDAQSLCSSDLPPLDEGMTNVTDGPRDGYRFTPHMTFGDDLHITVPYDGALIPAGLSEQDVQIFYYDTAQLQWVALQRDTLNQTTDQVESVSDHFTDMIAATVTVPDHPENVSFNPTSIKDLKAADPSAGVGLVQPPSGNSEGDARLSYPIALPSGRHGMGPSLQLGYSSAAGNGWLGVGWDLSVPSIGIDTRWGVPRYDAENETETYVVGSAQLTPVANRGPAVARTPEKVFHSRVEGGFDTIVRHGSAPTNYWWEVTDKSGTRSFYGGDPENGPVAAARLADDNGNVFRWALREFRDLHGNAVHYDYQTVSDAGVAGGTVPGRQLYLRSIDYTRSGSTPTTAGPYTVKFVRDSELSGYSRRADVVIDARGGFKMVTAELLSRIEVSFQGQPVRSYDLTYQNGAFGKKLLASVIQRGANNTALGTHTFSYYDDIRNATGGYDAFAPATNWTVGADGVTAGLLGRGQASAISGSLSTSTGGHLYAGYNATKPTKTGSVGAKVGFTHSSTDGKLALVDLNGDDLPDKVFKSGSGISVRFNTSGPDGSTDFGSPVATPTLPGIAKESADMSSFGAEVYLTVNAFANHAETFTKDTTYFSDVNGDGLTDLVDDGSVLFNHLDANGVPTFTANSSDTPVPIGTGILDTTGLVADYTASKNQQDTNNPPVDVLRRWTAPISGTVSITGNAALVQDTSPERAAYTSADGVRVAVQNNGTELWSAVIGATDYTAKTPTGVSSVTVTKGDRLYFRVGSRSDGAYDQVSWDPVIQYLSSPGVAKAAVLDANRLNGYRYQASQDFAMAGRGSTVVQAPLNGSVRLTGNLHKLGATSDDITLEVIKNGQVVTSQPMAWAASGDIPVQTDMTVAKGDTIALHVKVDTPIDVNKLAWTPALYYLSSPDVSKLTDDAGNPLIQLHPPFDIDTYPANTSTSVDGQQWTAPATETVSVKPVINAASGTNGTAIFTVKRRSALLAKRTITISNGVVSGTGAFPVDVTVNDFVFFNVASADPTLRAKITSKWVEVTRPGMAAVNPSLSWYSAATSGMLAAPYRGWTYVGYNGAGARGTSPIVEADLDQAFSSSSTYDPRTANAHPFYPSAEDGSWRGADGSAWIKATTMSASREGLDSISVPTASTVGGARAVSRLSHTTQDTVGAEVSFLSGSTSDGGTASDVDFLDLNGDRFPDIVSNGKVQYSTSTGGLDASSKTVSGLGAPRDSDASAVNVGVGGSPAHFAANGRGEVDTSNSGPVRGNKTGSQMTPLGLNAGLGKGTSKPKHDLLDVNGDGLPDVVSRNGPQLMVALNLGYGFAPAEPWGTATINDGASENGTIGATLGFNTGLYDFAGGLSLTKNKSLTRETLEDVNGDGLIDRVLPGGSSGMQVGLNTGNGFAAPIAWGGALDGACADDTSVGLAGLDWDHARLCSGSTGLGAGAYFTLGIPLCGTACYLILNPGADGDQSMARDEASLRDIDGDGYADHLASSDDGTLKVARNRTGRTNLLKSVSRPLGASFTVDYTRDGNTTTNPTSRWVLTSVTVTDGHVGDGPTTQATAYSYSGGVYDRLEREFYGYAQVTQQDLNTWGPDIVVYRSFVQTYRTDSLYTHGLLARQQLYTSAGYLFTDTENTYVLRDVTTGAEPADGTSTTATIFPMLTRADERFYERHLTPGKTTATTNHYDSYGDIDTTTDYGDSGTADDVIAQVGYTSCPTTGVRIANSITVTGGGTLMRRRESTVDCATGDLTQVRQYLADGTAAVTDISYTTDGNLLKVTDPPNAAGQRGWLSYDYDPPTHTQVERITDNFGLTSTATHDLRFGTMTSQTDENSNVESFSYDEFGRQTSVTGPYEQGGGPATITFEYHPEANDPWAITRHLDKYRSATDTIDTVVFIDGMGHTIQTKEDATVYTGPTSTPQDVMVVSGRVTLDPFYRKEHVQYPVTEPLGTPGVFNTNYDAVKYTDYDYDQLDRLTQETAPDGTDTDYDYAFGNDRSGTKQFQQKITDANGHIKYYYRNVRQQLVSLKEFHTPTGGTQQTIWTSYDYDPLSQLVTVTDDKNNITRQSFDNLGRRTVIDNPDTGRTTTSYDLASNLVAKVTANLRATSQQITYGYDVDRLVSISYPRFPANNVTYTYGTPGASDNRAGRITHVVDQAGNEDRYYGKLGETTKEVRTVVGFTGSSPKTYTTSYVYDTFGRQQSMVYPDGETLTYSYDSGGMVRAASGVKGGNSYSYVTRLEYDKFGQKAFVQDGNGVKTSYSFDPVMRRLSNQTAGPLLAPNGTDLGNFQNVSYGYDNVGNVTSTGNSVAVPAPPNFGGPTSQTFNYDDLDRLTDATGSYQFAPDKTNNYSYALSYDNLHNITSKAQTNTVVQGSGTPVTQGKTTYSQTYAYTGLQPHAPSHIGTQTYAYDANGNQLGWSDDNTGQQRTITWDEDNRIQSVADNGQTTTFKYDDAGQRIIKRGPQGETAYVNQFYTVRNGQIGTKHVFIATTRVASKLVKDNAFEKDSYYFHTDQLSSTNYVTDAGGKLYEHLEYFPSGESWVEEKSNTQRTPYRFAGKELDEETGLYYYGARYYDPRTGLWPSADPALNENLAHLPGDDKSPEPDVAAPTFLNLYNYADANPLTKIDPDGRQPFWNPFTQHIPSNVKARASQLAHKAAEAIKAEWNRPRNLVNPNAVSAVINWTLGPAQIAVGIELVLGDVTLLSKAPLLGRLLAKAGVSISLVGVYSIKSGISTTNRGVEQIQTAQKQGVMQTLSWGQWARDVANGTIVPIWMELSNPGGETFKVKITPQEGLDIIKSQLLYDQPEDSLLCTYCQPKPSRDYLPPSIRESPPKGS